MSQGIENSSKLFKGILPGIPALLAISFFGLLPARYTPRISILGNVPVTLKDLVLAVLSVLYMVICLAKNKMYSRKNVWHLHIPLFFILLVIYMTFSLYAISSISSDDRKAMAFTLLMAIVSFGLGYSVVSVVERENLLNYLWILAAILAGISAIYFAQSYFDLSLRTEIARSWNDFGIQRIRGPLYGSSTGAIVLIPAFALMVYMISQAKMRLISIITGFIICLALIGTGSRATLISLGLYLLMLLIFFRKANKVSVALLILLILVAAMYIVFSKATPQRLTIFADPIRELTYETGFRFFNKGTMLQKLVGRGYGAIWPWYRMDMQLSYTSYRTQIFTEMGYSAYHPHSVFMMLLSEMGIIGVVFWLLYWIALLKIGVELLRKKTPIFIYYAGIISSSIVMLFDLLIVKNFIISAIYWMFFFTTLKVASRQLDNVS